jgi:hypothetical protein
MDVRLRAFQDRDFEFVRELYFETMRWAIERYFGRNRLQQEENFSTWFKPNEARIITADGTDAGIGNSVESRRQRALEVDGWFTPQHANTNRTAKVVIGLESGFHLLRVE